MSDFDSLCDEFEREARGKPVSPEIARARRLLADDVSLETAWSEVQAVREAERVERIRGERRFQHS